MKERRTEREMDRERVPVMKANEKIEEASVTGDRKRNEALLNPLGQGTSQPHG